MSAKLISVIGPPAVGKTTLAELLAKDLPAELVREDYAGNPFLAGSYQGAADARLPAQLYFLMSRVSQLCVDAWPQRGLLVSDHGFCQDGLFARIRLTAHELGAYERIASRLAALVHPVDLLIHMDASAPLLLGRLAARGRTFEQAMDTEFLSVMRHGYNQIEQAAECPTIRVDCDKVDIMHAGRRRGLLERIRAVL